MGKPDAKIRCIFCGAYPKGVVALAAHFEAKHGRVVVMR